MQKRPKVVIIFRWVPQYRKKFYELLQTRLDEAGVDFLLIYGQTGAKEAVRKDQIELPWGQRIENKIFKIGSKEIYWQPCLEYLKDADLVIVEQASKFLLNYILVLQNMLGIRKVAFWGHGRNFQRGDRNWLAEIIKRGMSRHVFWWFAYNEMSAQIVESLGFPRERITSVMNAIDTKQLLKAKASVTPEELDRLRLEIGLTGENTMIYCGAMYEEKCLGFLLEACYLIKKEMQGFEIIFIGAGPDDYLVKEAAAKHPWIHYVGPNFDKEKPAYFLLSKLYLLPGGVGLGILDAFALDTPIVTTNKEGHGPEIDYLKHQFNGIMTEFDAKKYADSIIELLKNEILRTKLVNGCKQSVGQYSIESMVDNFAKGIVSALEEPI